MSRQIRSKDIKLDNQEQTSLRQKIRQTKEHKIADRYRVVLFKATGYSHQEIAKLLQSRNWRKIKRFFQNFCGVAAGLVPALGDHKGSPLHIGLCTENPKEPNRDQRVSHQGIDFVDQEYEWFGIMRRPAGQLFAQGGMLAALRQHLGPGLVYKQIAKRGSGPGTRYPT